MKCRTRAEQRGRTTARLMLSVSLEAHLDNLVREILDGDPAQSDEMSAKLVEFQQCVQCAPEGMRDRLILALENRAH